MSSARLSRKGLKFRDGRDELISVGEAKNLNPNQTLRDWALFQKKGAGMQVPFLVRRKSIRTRIEIALLGVSSGDGLSRSEPRGSSLSLMIRGGVALFIVGVCTLPLQAQAQFPSFPNVDGAEGLSSEIEEYVEAAQGAAADPNQNPANAGPSVSQQPGSVPQWTQTPGAQQQVPQWKPTQSVSTPASNNSNSIPLSQQPVAPTEGVADGLDSVRDPIFRLTSQQATLKIIERSAKVVHLKAGIKEIDGFDSEILSVTPISKHMVRVQALKQGISSLTIGDEFGQRYSVEVYALADVRELQHHLQQLFPRSSVTATVVRDTVVLRGWVTDPEHITQIEDLARRFSPEVLNQTQVAGVQRIQLRVKVMEVQRAKIRQLGFNFLRVDGDSYLASTPGQLVSVAGITATPGAIPGVAISPATLANPTVAYGAIGNSKVFQGFVEALKQESLLKILAEPVLAANNGRPAYMLAGGQFPILVPQSLGTTTIEWRDFGVRLEAVPTMLGQGRVRLQLMPEVSERDFSSAIELTGISVPGITTRQVNTEVEMKFGETIILAGLISKRETAETSKVPFFGELPWVGAAFRRVRYNEAETELVIMVTPELISPIDPMEMPAGGPGQFTDTPVDRELYIDGVLEVPKYGDECFGCQTGGVSQSYSTTGPQTGYQSGSQSAYPQQQPAYPTQSMPSTMPHEGSMSPGLIPPTGGPGLPATPPPAPAAQEAEDTGSAFWKTNFFKGKPTSSIHQAGASVNAGSSNKNVTHPSTSIAPPQNRGFMGLFRPRPGLLGPSQSAQTPTNNGVNR